MTKSAKKSVITNQLVDLAQLQLLLVMLELKPHLLVMELPLLVGKNAEMFPDKSVKMYPDNPAKMFPDKLPDRNANPFPDKNVQMFQDKSVKLSPDNNASKYQDKLLDR